MHWMDYKYLNDFLLFIVDLAHDSCFKISVLSQCNCPWCEQKKTRKKTDAHHRLSLMRAQQSPSNLRQWLKSSFLKPRSNQQNISWNNQKRGGNLKKWLNNVTQFIRTTIEIQEKDTQILFQFWLHSKNYLNILI